MIAWILLLIIIVGSGRFFARRSLTQSGWAIGCLPEITRIVGAALSCGMIAYTMLCRGYGAGAPICALFYAGGSVIASYGVEALLREAYNNLESCRNQQQQTTESEMEPID